MMKTITWSHWTTSTYDRQHFVSILRGCPILYTPEFDAKKQNYCCLPMFGGAGLTTGLLQACFNNNTVIIGPQYGC
jgi:hypothetical protein